MGPARCFGCCDGSAWLSGEPEKNDVIEGLQDLIIDQENTDSFHIFHAGTRVSEKDEKKL